VLPLVEYSSDPLVTSVYLAYFGYAQCMAGRYEAARHSLVRAHEACTRFRLTFNASLCDIIRAQIEIGERRWKEARRVIDALEKIAPDFEDPYVEASISVLRARLALALGALSTLSRLPKHPSVRTPPRSINGEYHALLALAAASEGALDQAEREMALARSLTSTVETVYITRFTETILSIVRETGGSNRARKAAQCLADANSAGVLDALVVAYRAYPQLLEVLKNEPDVAEIIRQTLVLARDTRLAAAYGFDNVTTSALAPPVGTLTRRETEVLDLLGRGLSNAAIAKRLVIAESTVKVHVNHVFKKLGAKTRLQAALLARDLLNDYDD
jgi:ATP/maltotriose-dependent transcriptional regulator MalT